MRQDANHTAPSLSELQTNAAPTLSVAEFEELLMGADGQVIGVQGSGLHDVMTIGEPGAVQTHRHRHRHRHRYRHRHRHRHTDTQTHRHRHTHTHTQTDTHTQTHTSSLLSSCSRMQRKTHACCALTPGPVAHSVWATAQGSVSTSLQRLVCGCFC